MRDPIPDPIPSEDQMDADYQKYCAEDVPEVLLHQPPRPIAHDWTQRIPGYAEGYTPNAADLTAETGEDA